MSELILDVTDDNFQTEVLESKQPVLVDFWAEWCGPCRQLGPTLEKIAEARKDVIRICKVNIEDSPTLAAKFNVRSIPFMAFIKNGELIKSLTGNQPENKILEAIDSF